MQSPRPRGCVSRYLESGRYRDRDDRQMPTWQNLRLWIVDRAKAEQTDPRLYWASAVKMASRRNSGKIPASKLHPSNYHKTQGKHSKVRFLSSPFQNPGFPRVFRISGQLLWSSVAPMQLGAWRLRRCISRRATQIESFFESRESSKHWVFECSGSALIGFRGGGWIRTICVVS
jgi:hypothetical protein